MPAFLYCKFNNTKQKFSCDFLTSIGRSRTNTIVLPDPKVSRNHLLFRCIGELKYYLIDIGSANGTYLNGKRVIVPSLLKDGDIIKLGSSVLKFQLDETTSDPLERTDVESFATLCVSDAILLRQVTVLVADIRDYTSISEQLPVNILAKLIGRWFHSTNDVIEKHGGVVDKFIGDAVMACWLINDKSPEKSIMQALRAAYELSVITKKLTPVQFKLPKPLRIGVGINTGKAVVGDMGSGRLQDYTVIGDSVNLAFRLEEASKKLDTDLVISQNSYNHLDKIFWENRQQFINLKGKAESTQVCHLKFNELSHLLR